MIRRDPLSLETLLREAYERMNGRFGDLRWWPADNEWEIIVGAILTQNTSWKNVEKAIANLKEAGLLKSPAAILAAAQQEIERNIRPCGYFRQKSKKLKIFSALLCERYAGSVSELQREVSVDLRSELLKIWGIGKETADTILLYALEVPFFVVDSYTIRILSRHGLCGERDRYDEVQALFTGGCSPDVPFFKQFHALFVATGKHFCRKSSPRCKECPLEGFNGWR